MLYFILYALLLIALAVTINLALMIAWALTDQLFKYIKPNNQEDQ